MFNINPLYFTDGYKVGHKAMLAPGTTKLYGTWIPRSFKHAPKGVTKAVSFGQQFVWTFIHDVFEKYFFKRDLVNSLARDFNIAYQESTNRGGNFNEESALELAKQEIKEEALQFVKDMSLYLGMEYDGKHFEELWDLGYLPIKVKALPEGLETGPNIPHMTFVNTVDGFAWLTLYLETFVSSLAWKPSTSATIARLYRRQAEEWVRKTDPTNMWLVDYLCHDFSARGLNPHDMIASGLGHATSFRGSDTLAVIPASRYYYGVGEDEMPINSVNASEHSVSTTKIFTVGEQQMIADWLKIFPEGILSLVADTFNLWWFITEFLPANKEAIMKRAGKVVVRPDSGDPVDIICGKISDTLNSIKEIKYFLQNFYWGSRSDKKYFIYEGNVYSVERETLDESAREYGQEQMFEFGTNTEIHDLVVGGRYSYITKEDISTSESKGVIELLWDIFGGTINEQGYKVLDPHIGALYGDSITPERQLAIYQRLAAKGFAATNIVLGVGSFTYQYNTRDTLGFAAKGAWFEVEDTTDSDCTNYITEVCKEVCEGCGCKKAYDIYKDPVTDDGSKKSLKGLQAVYQHSPEHKTHPNVIWCGSEVTPEEENQGLLQIIYEDGKFYNQSTLEEIRERLRETI